jgi:enterochelin esterase-like enzyme
VSLPRPYHSLRTATAALVGAAALVGLVCAGSPRAAAREQLLSVAGSFHSQALRGRLHFLVYLPPDYADGSRRYPVVYFLHGLPAGPTSCLALAWAHEALVRAGGTAILVVPQATRRANGDPEYQNWGTGRDWQTALSGELPAFVDVHYRTIASRAGRALVGVSAGGYGAAIMGLHAPAKFSVIESWSGYFRPTDATGEKTLELGSSAADADASVESLVPSLATQFRRYPTFFAFYVGRSDPTFVPDNTTLHRDLTAAGVGHVFALYKGGHTVTLWKAHAAAWLGLALSHLAPATAA